LARNRAHQSIGGIEGGGVKRRRRRNLNVGTAINRNINGVGITVLQSGWLISSLGMAGNEIHLKMASKKQCRISISYIHRLAGQYSYLLESVAA